MAEARTAGSRDTARRPLGRTGVEVCILGLGGYHLGVMKSQREAIRIVQEAVDGGITFLDNAWEYHDGRSEEIMGRAIAGARRAQVFLMTKVCTHGRGRREAMRQLEQSLRRLRTDHLDLWQVHEVVYENDPERHAAPGGVLEALDEARRQGKVRFVGFTGHKSPAIHQKMLRLDFPFDACQLPLNCLDGTFRSFERDVLPELNRRGIAPIGMKSMGGEADVVRKKVVSAEEAMRYAMSLPVATTVTGIDSVGVLRQGLRVLRGFQPMAPAEMEALRQRCAQAAADGRFELYKVSMKHEGPVGRKQRGFPTDAEMTA
jgi:aryl-alcohol dehydrogenase-like predicted oxidoreductase